MPDLIVCMDSGGTWVPLSSAGAGSALLTNSQEGGTNGVAATAGSGGNTGGASGHYFNAVVGTVTFSNEHPANGLMGFKCVQDPTTAGPARVTWTGGTLGTLASGTKVYLRAYMYWSALPTSTQTILQGRLTASGASFSVRYTTTGAIALYDSTNTVVYTSAVVPTGKLVRVEVMALLHATAGKLAAKVYYYDGAGHTMQGSTPVLTVGSETTGSIATRGSMDAADFGLSSSSTGHTLWTSDVALSTSSWIGPTSSAGTATGADFYRDSGGWIPGGQIIEESGGAWWGSTAPAPSVPPGLVPNRVIAGWYSAKGSHNNDPDHAAVIMNPANDSIAPGAWWQGSGDHARTIPGGLTRKQTPVYKEFNPGGFMTKAELLSNLADADAAGYFLVQTTKVPAAPGGRIQTSDGKDVNDYDWAGVAAGNYDSILTQYADVALDRAGAGKRGFFLTFHHEPNSDYTTSLSTLPIKTATPDTWAAMQEYCSWFFAGHLDGTASPTNYDATRDTRANLSWGCIPNGFMFTSATLKASLDKLMPASLISAFNTNHGIIAVDIYDNNKAGQHLYQKIDAVYAWCKARGVKHAGIAETGAYDVATLQAAWETIYTKGDLFRFVIYWDSGIGAVPTGATDWRLLPNGYPADSLAPPLDSHGVGAKGPFVGPGTAVTEALLLYWRDTAVPQSEAMT